MGPHFYLELARASQDAILLRALRDTWCDVHRDLQVVSHCIALHNHSAAGADGDATADTTAEGARLKCVLDGLSAAAPVFQS